MKNYTAGNVLGQAIVNFLFVLPIGIAPQTILSLLCCLVGQWLINRVIDEQALRFFFGGPIGYWQLFGLVFVYQILFQRSIKIGSK